MKSTCQIRISSEPYDGTHELTPKEQEELALGLDIPQGYLTKLSEDGLRNALILNKVFELIRNGHQRILVCHQRSPR